MKEGKIFITGTSGFIGHHLAYKLLSQGYSVTGIDNFSFGRKEFLKNAFHNPDFSLYKGDIADIELIKKIINNEEPETIFHLAALHFIPYCVENPLKTINVNVAGTQTLIDGLEKSSIENFVFISTGDIYEPSINPHKETDIAKPFNIYGLSKLMGEQLIELAEKRYPYIKFNIVRLFNVYGPEETNLHILPDIITMLKKERMLKLGNISPIRDYIFINDVVEGLIRIGNYNGREKIFNLAGGNPVSVKEMVGIISEILKEKIEIETDQSKVRKTERQILKADLSKLKQELNWQPVTNLYKGIKSILVSEGLLK